MVSLASSYMDFSFCQHYAGKVHLSLVLFYGIFTQAVDGISQAIQRFSDSVERAALR
jgi:hypothetical protein